MNRPRVFVTRQIPECGLEQLRQHCDVEVWDGRLPPSREVLLEKVVGCQALLTLLSDRIDGELLDAAGPELRVISNFAVGYNNIDVRLAASRGIRIGNTPDVLTDATADMAMCLLLAAARHLKPAIDAVRSGAWKTWEPLGLLGTELAGKTVGVIGLGRIGATFARRCHGGWETPIVYHSRQAKPILETALAARLLPLEELLATSDIVSLHCPLNENTRHLLNRDRLAIMKPGTILINTARGEIIEQDALHWALTAGPLAAAGLDVTDPEPLDPACPLVPLDNCVIAPHIGSSTRSARDAMSRIAAENILAALGNESMPAEVSP
ncbi:2-hydroxyacid dehydrogenase [Planctomycetaceae bacterium SH139]